MNLYFEYNCDSVKHFKPVGSDQGFKILLFSLQAGVIVSRSPAQMGNMLLDEMKRLGLVTK